MNENFELENMRQQMETLKKKLDQQEIVNDRFIRQSMKKNADNIIRRYHILMAIGQRRPTARRTAWNTTMPTTATMLLLCRSRVTTPTNTSRQTAVFLSRKAVSSRQRTVIRHSYIIKERARGLGVW
jgi:hypothetical protein